MLFIGNQTSCWTARPSEPFDYAVAQCFTAFEWFPDKKPGVGWDESDLDKGARQSIRSTAQAAGMRLSVHGQWLANPLDANNYPLLWKDFALAVDLGAALLNIHLFHENGLPAFVEAIAPLLEKARQAGLHLAIENTPQHTPEQFNELFARLGELSSVNTRPVGMCLDLGHANLASSTHNDYLNFVDRLDPQVPIIHVHLHENWGDTDSHLPLFTGPSGKDDSGIRGLVARLKQRNFSGSIIFEQWPQPPSLLKEARDRFQTIWDSTPDNPPGKELSSNSEPNPPLLNTNDRDDFVAQLAASDRRSRSWREKLQFICELIEKPQPAVTSEQLVHIAVYLRFLGTGAIRCTEDGRHFRPAHHARLSARIQQQLAKFNALNDQFVLRKLYPWLPSSSSDFQRPEPLTRIRDIAHRNDIDSELKREIKTRLQNKLHRCAGPEDLVTSSEILDRISAPGANYPSAFVAEFRIFHQELKEFFNANSLEDRLKALRPEAKPPLAELIENFLGQKGNAGLSEQMALLETLTQLREAFAELVSGRPPQEAQDIVLADISLEDFAFALLSQMMNACDHVTAGEAMGARIQMLLLALRNIALSQINVPETRALFAELTAWGIPGPKARLEETLRLRASLLRCRRLAEDFSMRIVSLFASKADKVGRALGVSEHAYRVFAEADIRSHLIFQVSKLTDALLRSIREVLALPPWDVIVPGKALGHAAVLNSLANQNDLGPGPAVVLLNHADGDEEIPTSVVAIVLAHEMPHLAHLSVRARQAGVVFTTCNEPAEFSRLLADEGTTVAVAAQVEGLDWRRAPQGVSNVAALPRKSPQIPKPDLSAVQPWIPVESVQVTNGGSKAVGVRRLAELSVKHAQLFSTPWSVVIPFGVMKAALDASPSVGAEYGRLVRQINDLREAEFAACLERLQSLVRQLKVPEEIIAEVRHRTTKNGSVIVRSSANGEDLENFSAAGLYESVPNVSRQGLEGAIRQVWASLWTRRAAESRRSANLRHEEAHMAVLIQEFFNPEFAFVLHTVDPAAQDSRSLYAELVVGLGETLVSAATAGTPYRLKCQKPSGPAKILAFANFSYALGAESGAALRKETLDYSQVRLSTNLEALAELGNRLAKIGTTVERGLGGPQDIEGFVSNDNVYLVQARPQQGASRPTLA